MEIEEDSDDSILAKNQYYPLNNNPEDPDNFSSFNANRHKRRREQTPQGDQVSANTVAKTFPPPPLVILGQKITELKSNLLALNINDYSIKLTSDGARVFTRNADDYKKVKVSLIEAKTSFFTHRLREEQTSKFVIYGLPKVDTNDIKTELIEAKLCPAEVKQMTTKKSNENSAIYVIYFLKKDKVRLIDLQKIKILMHMRVSFAHYNNKSKGPTQCSNCLRFGHGVDNCHAPARCIRCAKPHISAECPLIANPNGVPLTRISNDLLQCVHCGLQHAANFSGCPKRQEYMSRRFQTQSGQHKKKMPQQQQQQKVTFTDAPQLSHAHFPMIPTQSLSTQPAWTNPKSTSFNSNEKQHENTNDAHINDDKFSYEELNDIMQEMIKAIPQARNKQEQISIIARITLKYLASSEQK